MHPMTYIMNPCPGDESNPPRCCHGSLLEDLQRFGCTLDGFFWSVEQAVDSDFMATQWWINGDLMVIFNGDLMPRGDLMVI
jgi:hypothetical protein